jgi:hypothetical protein
MPLKKFGKDLPLVHYRLHALLCYHSRFINDFQGINSLSLLLSHFPHSAKTTLSNNSQEVEHRLGICISEQVHSRAPGSSFTLPQPLPMIILYHFEQIITNDQTNIKLMLPMLRFSCSSLLLSTFASSFLINLSIAACR